MKKKIKINKNDTAQKLKKKNTYCRTLIVSKSYNKSFKI